jgi:hypothetical protein
MMLASKNKVEERITENANKVCVGVTVVIKMWDRGFLYLTF